MPPTLLYHHECPQDWDELVLSCAWGSFYHSRLNLQTVMEETGARLEFWTAAGEDGRLTGGLVAASVAGAAGIVYNSLPFFGSYGDAVCSEDAEPQTQKLLYEAMLLFCRERGALAATVITSPLAEVGHHAEVRECLKPIFTDVRRCQITTLPAAEGCSREAYLDKLFRVFEGRARTAYRRALQEKMQVEVNPVDEAWDTVLDLHQANIGGKGGRCKTRTFFSYARALAREDGNAVRLYVARLGGMVIAGILLFYHGNTVEYHTTGMDDEYRAVGAVNQLITEAMIDAGLSGYRLWNFGGTWSSQEGVYKFKRSFGSLEYPYEYHTVFFGDPEPVRRMSAAELLAMYPGFFVLPFSKLSSQ